ncbi:MAG: phytanoyl-CoA dioxygenase family protein [Planctomycetota bacterium]
MSEFFPSSAPIGDPLAAAPRDFFDANGYLVVEDALTSTEIDELREDAVAICRGDHGSIDRGSANRDGETDEEVMRRYLCVHHPQKFSPVVRRYLAHPAIVRVLTGVIGPDVKAVQSMLFLKSAGQPGQAWHQDEDYIPTRDRSLTGAWIALDDATVENGCLWVIPGSHRPGVLWPQRAQVDPRFDCSEESHRFPYSDDDAVPVPVSAGAVVFFNGYLLHRSLPNRAESGFRRTLVNHYMSASSLLPWCALPDHDTFLDDTKYVSKADMRDIVMVAGTDPYAWMGTKDVFRPLIRPSGEGGCARAPTDDSTHSNEG